MEYVSNMLTGIIEFEKEFDAQIWTKYTRAHAEIPIFAVSLYLLMVFQLPVLIKHMSTSHSNTHSRRNSVSNTINYSPIQEGDLNGSSGSVQNESNKTLRKSIANGKDGTRRWSNNGKLNLRPVVAVWNILLAIFSTMGFVRIAPVLYAKVNQHGFHAAICTDPYHWYRSGPPGLWMTLFVYSKILELFDTLFLVLQQKKVIFLHWYAQIQNSHRPH